ncbi:MAG: ABC transporter substrate-binding protein, partial [Candidatus Binatia bacterium]
MEYRSTPEDNPRVLTGAKNPWICSTYLTIRSIKARYLWEQERIMIRTHGIHWIGFGLSFFAAYLSSTPVSFAQTLEKMRLGYSGTGINNYVLEIGRRSGIFRRNGLDLEVVYVNSGSLLNQALIAGTFDVSFSQGSESMLAKLRGADMRITAVPANRFNHVYLGAPGITSFKQLRGKKVAVSR